MANVPHQTGRLEFRRRVDLLPHLRRARAARRSWSCTAPTITNSYDWIGVAGALASDREVVAFDRRGWGESTWSPSKDYSIDAHVGDMLAVIVHDEMGKVDHHGPFRRRPRGHLVRRQLSRRSQGS